MIGLAKACKTMDAFKKQIEPWWEQINQWKAKAPITYDQPMDGEIKPQYALDMLYQMTHGDAIVTTDVGQHQMWAAQFFKFAKSHYWCTSGAWEPWVSVFLRRSAPSLLFRKRR